MISFWYSLLPMPLHLDDERLKLGCTAERANGCRLIGDRLAALGKFRQYSPAPVVVGAVRLCLAMNAQSCLLHALEHCLLLVK